MCSPERKQRAAAVKSYGHRHRCDDFRVEIPGNGLVVDPAFGANVSVLGGYVLVHWFKQTNTSEVIARATVTDSKKAAQATGYKPRGIPPLGRK